MIQMTRRQLKEEKRKAKIEGIIETLVLMTVYSLFLFGTVYMFMK